MKHLEQETGGHGSISDHRQTPNGLGEHCLVFSHVVRLDFCICEHLNSGGRALHNRLGIWLHYGTEGFDSCVDIKVEEESLYERERDP